MLKLVAGAEVENGVGREAAEVPATRLQAYVAIPYAAEELEAVVAGIRPRARQAAWRAQIDRRSRNRTERGE